MSDVRFFVHLFDDSYINAKCKDIEENFSDFNDLVREQHKNSVISFSYDEDFFNVPTYENVLMANCIYSPEFDNQTRLNFEKTLKILRPLEKKIANISSFKTSRPSGSDYSFWGFLFQNKSAWCMSCLDEAQKYLNKQYNAFLSPENFWALKDLVFPKLKFIKNIKESIKTITGERFAAVKKDLVALNTYLSNYDAKNFIERDFADCTGVSISGESETVRNDQNLRSLRYFDIPNVGNVFCELHMKTKHHRTHIYPDRGSNIMWIAYIGPHLPTAKY
jgi:hypothetical protein